VCAGGPMLTAGELAQVPILAGVPEAELEALVRVSPDIHLQPPRPRSRSG